MILELPAPSLIAEATRINGSLTFFSAANIFGVVEGDIFQQSLESIQIGKTGWVVGSILSHGPVKVEGRVEGNITSMTKIQIYPTAIVRGRLKAPTIEILAGAIVEGDLVMEQTSFQPKLERAA